VRVEEVPAEATHDLRWRILRNRRPDASVIFPEDARPGVFHLAVRDDAAPDAVLAVASFSPEATPHRPGRTAVHLRGMAVDEAFQRHGLGRLLVTTAVERLRVDGVAVLWCNARDSAIGFYERLGFEVAGEGFVLAGTGFAHHVMLRDL
jgi:ribosomal protein S18 acetylase RimI-like enzyme